MRRVCIRRGVWEKRGRGGGEGFIFRRGEGGLKGVSLCVGRRGFGKGVWWS